MAQGLGKNSPVKLTLGKDNYEALIERHGQYVRWRQMHKCPCVESYNQQPNIRCKKCGGSGFLFGFQKSYRQSIMLQVINNTIELPEELSDCTVEKIYNYVGQEYKFIKEDNYIQLKDVEHPLSRGEMVEIVYSNSLLATIKAAEFERIAPGFYKLKDLKAEKPKIQGVYYAPDCDIVSIDSVKNEADEEIEIIDYRQNTISVDKSIDDEKLIAKNIKYMKPFKFIILSQNLKQAELDLIQKHSGDAVCTFPYIYDVAEGDIITILSGTSTNKILLNRGRDDEDDIIPEFFVESVLEIETKETKYIVNKDFIIAGLNRIHWLASDKPKQNTALSIVYKYNPSYKVVKDVPMLRTSENQRIPKKVVLQLFSSYQEAQGVHLNG